MAYCIMNIQKGRRHDVKGLQIEETRKPGDEGRYHFPNSNIDWSRTRTNIPLVSAPVWNREITRQIKDAGVKERKDSVVMVSAVYTASPEWFWEHPRSDWRDYFNACLAYHERTYGKAFSATVHLDEETPHMHVHSVPIVRDEKGAHLSAKIVCGNRADYYRRQDEFAEQVGKAFGMERGERSETGKAKKHQTAAEHRREAAEKAAESAEIKLSGLKADVSALTIEKAVLDGSVRSLKRQQADAEWERDRARAEAAQTRSEAEAVQAAADRKLDSVNALAAALVGKQEQLETWTKQYDQAVFEIACDWMDGNAEEANAFADAVADRFRGDVPIGDDER